MGNLWISFFSHLIFGKFNILANIPLGKYYFFLDERLRLIFLYPLQTNPLPISSYTPPPSRSQTPSPTARYPVLFFIVLEFATFTEQIFIPTYIPTHLPSKLFIYFLFTLIFTSLSPFTPLHTQSLFPFVALTLSFHYSVIEFLLITFTEPLIPASPAPSFLQHHRLDSFILSYHR